MDKCPFCGAAKLKEPQYAMDYECGHIDKPGFRHEVCAMRQITTLQAQLADREAEIARLKRKPQVHDVDKYYPDNE